MNITDEAHEAASRAAEDAYRRWHATPNRDAYVSGFIAAAAKGAVEAAAPLIAAQALRSRDADVAEALRSARSTLTLSSQDWSVRHDLAWLYGILVGWDDDPDDPHPVDAMADVAARCGWNADNVARLRRLAAAVAGVAFGDTAARERSQPILLDRCLLCGQPGHQPEVCPRYDRRHAARCPQCDSRVCCDHCHHAQAAL
jgi:hypothetical protein